MNDCLELIAELVAIYLVPSDGDYSYLHPFHILAHSVDMASVVHSGGSSFLESIVHERGMITESFMNDSVHARSLSINDGPTLKVAEKTNVAGRYYEVTLSASTVQPIELVRSYVGDMQEYESFDMFLLDAEGNWYLVRGMAPANAITAACKLPDRDTHEITVTSSNVNGVQRILS